MPLPVLAPLRHADGLCECPLIRVDRKSSADSQNVAFDPERTSALRQPDDPHPFIDDAFDLGGVEGIELPSTLALPLRSDLRSAGRLRRLVELTNDVQHPRLFL
jgi:hypothetical protein